MTSSGAGWSATPGTAPAADPTLISRALGVLGTGKNLGDLFDPKAPPEVKKFLEGLGARARAALENASRPEKG